MVNRITVTAGDVYGNLTVFKELPSKRFRDGKLLRVFLCRCSCGKTKRIILCNLRGPNGTRSCGCLARKKLATRNWRHGKSRSRAWRTWKNMLTRCYNKNDQAYKRYGGRGIIVSPEWHTFQRFFKDMGDPPPGRSLDRRDNNGHYCKDNCRWATHKEQGRNKRNNRLLTLNGKTQCLSAWCEETGLGRDMLHSRIKNGWPIERALTAPAHARACYSTASM